MHFDSLNAYYYFASRGDKEAYEKLYNGFILRAESQIADAGYLVPKNTEISMDFYNYVDELFFKIINDYEEERSSFNVFVEFVLKVRLVNIYNKLMAKWRYTSSFVEFNEVEHSIAAKAMITDPDVPSLRQDIEVSNFKFRIASGKFANNEKRFRNKVIMMVYAGFKPKEIEDTLKISRGKLRYILNQIKDDDDIVNLKLELK